MPTMLQQVKLYLAHRRRMGFQMRGADTLSDDCSLMRVDFD